MTTYSPRLLAVARAFAEDADDAADILQDVWITAAKHAHSRPTNAPIAAWLYTVTLNAGRQRRRRRQARATLMRLWKHLITPAKGRTQSPKIEEEVLRAQLWRSVDALPRLQREVVILRIVEDLSTADTARLLHRAEGTVKAALSQGLSKLRGMVGPVWDPSPRATNTLSESRFLPKREPTHG